MKIYILKSKEYSLTYTSNYRWNWYRQTRISETTFKIFLLEIEPKYKVYKTYDLILYNRIFIMYIFSQYTKKISIFNVVENNGNYYLFNTESRTILIEISEKNLIQAIKDHLKYKKIIEKYIDRLKNEFNFLSRNKI